MSVKKETQRRSIELTLEVPGTPEEVWRAVATGPGTTAWFVPTEIEERAGGALLFHLLPGMDAPGRVTVWQPPERFAYEEANWSEGAPPLATEILVEARAGGTCLVRMVHSLFTSSDQWDDELEGMENGWLPFFEVLRIYLAHYPGQRCTPLQLLRVPSASVEHVWGVLSTALGAPGISASARSASARSASARSASANAASANAAPGAEAPVVKTPRLVGQRVWAKEVGKQRCAVFQLEEPAPGALIVSCFGWGGQTHASLSHYVYGPADTRGAQSAGPNDAAPSDAAQRTEAEWRAWFDALALDEAQSSSKDA